MALTTDSANIGTINGDYPVAGQDNDSQGFRDNFTKIKTELTNAHADLTSLDTNTVKSNDAITNMQGNTIQNLVLHRSSQKFYSGGVLSSAGVRPVSYEIATYLLTQLIVQELLYNLLIGHQVVSMQKYY